MADLVSFGELSKPATTLIEKVANAISGVSAPWQIKRIARAESEADKIRAEADIEISELWQRAVRRFFAEETKKQNNIESIAFKAIPEVSDKAKPEDVEDDWIVNFFDKCRLISDEEMQALWARILAGEANSPGKFSKKTVNLVSALDKSDAELFTRVCSFGVWIGRNFEILVYNECDKVYTDHGISFDSLCDLEAIGLIRISYESPYTLRSLPEEGFASYFGQKVGLKFPHGLTFFDMGKVMLTQAGRELVTVCRTSPRDGFIDYVKERWQSFGYKTEP